MNSHDQQNSILLVDESRGVYVPMTFAKRYSQFLSEADKDVLLAGPDHPEYLDCWDDVLQNTTITDNAGLKYHLYQDGDLFAIPA